MVIRCFHLLPWCTQQLVCKRNSENYATNQQLGAAGKRWKYNLTVNNILSMCTRERYGPEQQLDAARGKVEALRQQ